VDHRLATLIALVLVLPSALAAQPGVASADGDGDGVNDEIEERICSSPVAASAVASLEGAGSCPSGTDYQPDRSLGLLVPNQVEAGTDVDGDGLPASVEVRFDHVAVDRRAETSHVVEGPTTELAVDQAPYGDDADPEREGLSTIVCRDLGLLTGVANPDDEDDDGFPAYVEVARTEVCVDTRDASVHLEGAYRVVPVDVDPDDEDDATPSGDTRELEPVPAGAEVGPDRDRDTVVEEVAVRELVATYDRRAPADVDVQTTWRTVPLDPDDHDPDRPLALPTPEEDGDHDHVRDGVEHRLCLDEDANTSADGNCSGPLSYEPTQLYQMVTAPAVGHHGGG